MNFLLLYFHFIHIQLVFFYICLNFILDYFCLNSQFFFFYLIIIFTVIFQFSSHSHLSQLNKKV